MYPTTRTLSVQAGDEPAPECGGPVDISSAISKLLSREYVKLKSGGRLVVMPDTHHATPIAEPEKFNTVLALLPAKYRERVQRNQSIVMRTRFIMVRHGQTEWNLGERFRGRADIPLNDTGIDQARRAAARLAAEPIDAIYASPLARTLRTAELVAGSRAKVVPEPALMDIDYGTWQGLTRDEASQRDAELYKLWMSAPEQVRFPGGGRLADVRERAVRAVEQWALQYDARSVLLVTHDIVAKLIFCALLDLEDSAFRHFEQDNAAINRFEVRDGMFVIKTVNETSHLL